MLTGHLGGSAVHVIRAGALPFAGTATTGAVSCFRVGASPAGIRFREVRSLDDLDDLDRGKSIPRPRLLKERRWSTFVRPVVQRPHGHLELGELCRVHRGQVTGCNRVWVAGTYPGRLPEAVLEPVVTRARELFDAGTALRDASLLHCLVSLPEDLDELDECARSRVDLFLGWARKQGAHRSYVAAHRRKWWSVPLRSPAPILCTYMARRPPAFVRNLCGARHLNIAHGLYPRDPASAAMLDALSAWLRNNVTTSAGRTYAGGLVKFEPREVERILIPSLEELHERTETLRRASATRQEARVSFLPSPVSVRRTGPDSSARATTRVAPTTTSVRKRTVGDGLVPSRADRLPHQARATARVAPTTTSVRKRTVGDGLVPSRADRLPHQARATARVAPTTPSVRKRTVGDGLVPSRGRPAAASGAGDRKGRPHKR